MLSTISPSVTTLAVGPPAQRAIAQRFSAVAHFRAIGQFEEPLPFDPPLSA